MSTALLIVDGSHLVYRCVAVTDEDTHPDRAGLRGCLRGLLAVHERWGGRVFVAWEGKGNFRYDLWPEYKQKPETEESRALRDAARQAAQTLRVVLASVGLVQFSTVGFEADDAIGTMAAGASRRGLQTLIYSGDSDLLQLVDAHVSVVASRPGGEAVFTPEAVRKKFGVDPSQIPALKALAGDKSDNIPGLKGIGPKKAAALLQEYGGLDKMLAVAATTERLDTGHMGKAGHLGVAMTRTIAQSRESLMLWLKLATIVCTATLKPIPRGDGSGAPQVLERYGLRDYMAPGRLAGLRRLAR